MPITQKARSGLPIRVADRDVVTDIRVYLGSSAEKVYAVLIFGSPDTTPEPLVRIHSGCLTGDIFGSRRCECGQQLGFAVERITKEGSGVIIYIPWHEGRGIGLLHKIRAYALQEEGADTVDANLLLGFDADHRNYYEAADLIKDLGLPNVRLMSNNPVKFAHLAERGVRATRVGLPAFRNPYNSYYVNTKHERLGHLP